MTWASRTWSRADEFIAPVIATGASASSLSSASEPWQFVLFGSFSAAGVVWGSIKAFSTSRYVESPSIRKRCHRVLSEMVSTLLPNDKTVETTVLLPRQTKNGLVIRPEVRHSPNKPFSNPRSKAVFRMSDNNSLITRAWNDPYNVYANPVPSSDFTTDDNARGFFQSALEIPEAEMKRVSQRTLREIKWLANVSFKLAYQKSPVGILSFTGTSDETPYDELTKPDYSEPLGDMLKTLAYLLSE